MKICFMLMGLALNSIAFGAPCEGAPGKNHINPDKSKGGFVANSARVATTVFLDTSSAVCEQAKVNGKVKIESGSWIGGNAIIEGSSEIKSSRVFGSSKVHRNAKVEKSSICQESDIYFDLLEYEYFCQTGDPEPKPLGDAGKKNLLGIDSDVDGVRDDVEIWINNITTNRKDRDMYNERMILKHIAKLFQKNLLEKDNKDRSRTFQLLILDSLSCLSDITKSESEYESLRSGIYIQSFNTMERLYADVRMESSLDGYIFEFKPREKRSTCPSEVKLKSAAVDTVESPIENDPEPKHPGEKGKQTLLGIDSDADGVRDDVEIWINKRTPNITNHEIYNLRIGLKNVARLIQKNLVVKDDPLASRDLKLQTLDAFGCISDLSPTKEFFYDIESDLASEIFNTKERIEADFKTRSSLAGYAEEVVLKPKYSECKFQLRFK